MRIVAITGGGQGIGRGIALAFAKAGYAVSIADPVTDGGEETIALIKAGGGLGLYDPADTSQNSHVERWMGRTLAELGCPNILINNAGIMIRKPFLELSEAEFNRVYAVNALGAFLCSQAVARAMIAHKIGGAIVNIASTRALMSEPGTEAYTASKGAIVALTHGMAISLGAHGIRVNCVSPGWIETGDWQYSARAVAPKHTQKDKEQHPVGRVGTPHDIAKACLFLAEHADFMTGQNLVVDGGMTIKMIYE